MRATEQSVNMLEAPCVAEKVGGKGAAGECGRSPSFRQPQVPASDFGCECSPPTLEPNLASYTTYLWVFLSEMRGPEMEGWGDYEHSHPLCIVRFQAPQYEKTPADLL